MADLKAWNLDDPREAWKFLQQVEINGKRVHFNTTADGATVRLDEKIADYYLVAYAKQLQSIQAQYEARIAKEKGKVQ